MSEVFDREGENRAAAAAAALARRKWREAQDRKGHEETPHNSQVRWGACSEEPFGIPLLFFSHPKDTGYEYWVGIRARPSTDKDLSRIIKEEGREKDLRGRDEVYIVASTGKVIYLSDSSSPILWVNIDSIPQPQDEE